MWLDLLSTFVLTPLLIFTEEDPDLRECGREGAYKIGREERDGRMGRNLGLGEEVWAINGLNCARNKISRV